MKELLNIQSQLIAPKDLQNKFGGYSYRSTESILAALKPLLLANNCTLNISDDVVLIGNKNYIKATATLKNSTGEMEASSAFAREDDVLKGMQSAQITGAASSYARKYALNGLFAIDDTKDADATNDGKQDKQSPPKTHDAKPRSEIKKEWLNPGTKAWENAVTLLKSGTPIDVIKATYLISKANETKLIEEGK